MDNDLVNIRRKISILRADMLELEAAIRQQIARDEDCSANAGKVLDMRAQMLALIGQRQALCAEGVPQPVIGKRRYEMTRIIRGMPTASS